MSEIPKALRLAENLVNQWWGMTASPSGLPEVSLVAVAALRVDAARLLREQHAEIERLKAALPYDWDQLEACSGSLREHMAEIERLKAVALQAQNAAIDLAKKIPRLSADDAAQVIGMMNQRSVRMTECRDPSQACLYPRCMDEGRCNLLMSGLCSGPRAADPQQVPR